MQLVEFILGLAALILIHEFGHFAAARLLRVEVEEFGLGFPPRAVKLFEYKGTVYSLNWIPLGGFVRLKGENDPDVPGGFASASPWTRLAVLFAGPLMNLMVGAILAAMLFYSWGDPVADKVVISYVAPGSPAEQAGLLDDDLFLEVNGEHVDSVEKLQSLVDQSLGQPTTVVVQRGGQTVTVTLVPRVNPPENEGAMGVGLSNMTQPVSVTVALQRGVEATYQQIVGMVHFAERIFNGQVDPEQGRLVGYKGMYDIYVQVQSRLWFFMVISTTLGIMNLLPIPALDGGRILLTLPEIIIRRRIPARYENAIHLIGFAALLILLIYINLQDFINPIQLP